MVCFWYPGFWWLPTYRTSEHNVNSSRGGGITITKCFLIFEHEIKPVECNFKCASSSNYDIPQYLNNNIEYLLYLDFDPNKILYIDENSGTRKCSIISEDGKSLFNNCRIYQIDRNWNEIGLEVDSLTLSVFLPYQGGASCI